MPFEWKQQAKAALRNHWQTALLIALIVNLPTLLVQAVATATNSDLSVKLMDLLYASLNQGAMPEAMLASAIEIIREPMTGILTVAGLIAGLLTPFLAMGMNAWMLDRLKGAEDLGPVHGALCRKQCFLKGIGQRLLITAKIFLWMVPGMVLCALSMLPLINIKVGTVAELESAMRVPMFLYSLCSFVMLFMGIRAALHYGLAEMILADRPDNGVRASVHESIALMRKRKMKLLTLFVSFVGWYLLILLVNSLATGMAGNVIGMMVNMLCNLALTVYMNTTVAAFYESCRKESRPAETAA